MIMSVASFLKSSQIVSDIIVLTRVMNETVKRMIKAKYPRSDSPGNWVFEYKTLKWMFDPSLGRQLPLPYQVFRAYCRLYFAIFHGHLLAGKQLFKAAASISSFLVRQDYIRLRLKDYEVYLDYSDPRFLQVVNELTSNQADNRALSNLLAEGDTFIDVGANHGSFSIVASKLVGAKGCVVAIEPQPRLASAIEKSLALNAQCSFQVHQMALGDDDGEIELMIPCDTSGSAGIYPGHSGTHKHRTIIVPLRRFDEAVDWQYFPGKSLIKLDIEGSEYVFLKGARRMIASLKPNLLVEINPRTLKASGVTGGDLKHLLIEFGYGQYAELKSLQETLPIENLDIQRHRNILVCPI